MGAVAIVAAADVPGDNDVGDEDGAESNPAAADAGTASTTEEIAGGDEEDGVASSINLLLRVATVV